MRFLRSRSDDLLNDAENASLAPTTAEMNEFLRQVTRLKEDVQECAERLSTSLHRQDPPPQYSLVPSRSVRSRQRSRPPAWRASQIPLPTQRVSDIQNVVSNLPPRDENDSISSPQRESGWTRRSVVGLAPTPTTHGIRNLHVAHRAMNPLPEEVLMLTGSGVSLVTTHLYQIFTESHPDMPIQQARYYARSLRNAMLPHTINSYGTAARHPISELVRETNGRSEPMRRDGADGTSSSDSVSDVSSTDVFAHRNEVSPTNVILPTDGVASVSGESHIREPIPLPMCAGLSSDAVESSATSIPPRRLSVELPPDLHELLANSIHGTMRPPSTSAHLNGDDTAESVSSSGSSDATLVYGSSNEELPVIRLRLPPHSDDGSDNELPVVEMHLPPNGYADGSDDETLTDESRRS